MFQDESHLLWGDMIGYAWGIRGKRLEIDIKNERRKQSYYGAVNLLTGEAFANPYSAGNSEETIRFLKSLRRRFQGRRIILLWDGASYHQSKEVKAYLASINGNLPENERKIELIRFAPNAPEQNPMEDVWLAAKNQLRTRQVELTTFNDVVASFSTFTNNFTLKSAKFDWYKPSPHPV